MRYLIAVMGAHGHVNPALAIAGELVRRGHDVAVFVPEAYASAAEALGATPLIYESGFAASRKALDKPSDHIVDFPTRLAAECRLVLPQLIQAARAVKPDVLLYDKMLYAGAYAARALGIPAAILSPTYAEGPSFSVAAQRGLRAEASPAFRAEVEALERDHGLPRFTPEAAFYRAEALNLVCLPRAFQPEAEAFDKRYEFIGPCLSLSESELVTAPKTGRPLVYVSLGTVFNAAPEFFRQALAGLGDAPWDVLVAYGEAVDRDALGAVPANVQVQPFVDQLSVLKQASVFVTHGGMNSTMEALTFGVPMVVVPQMPEQEVTAQRLAELELGVAVAKRDADAATLRATVQALLAGRERGRRLAVMKAATRAAGGTRRAADLLEAYATQIAVRPAAFADAHGTHAGG